ncbi:MAG: ChaN family lipoprotein [Bdellovibrionales bacterium]|nr:ChaN family lipoprotein [Bdellovibrionales bacterium]
MINPRHWLRTRRKLLEQVKAQVQLRLGPLPPALRQYAKSIDREFRGAWRPVSEKDLQPAIKKAQIVLGADFHAYAQSQRAHIRVLRDHVSQARVVLALECLGHEHDQVTEDFLRGRISESRFLEKVEWDKNWGFPWEHYRPLFELARDRRFKVCGLNNTRLRDLNRRDQWAAKTLLRLHKQDPESLIYAVIGEWHLARAHLPRLCQAGLGDPGRLVVLFQDVEPLYFRLAQKSNESAVELLKAKDNRFCLMVSPPWMKWQSYLMYLEQAYDRDLQEDLAIDYSDHVVSLVELLENDLKVETKKSRIQVYCPNSRTSLARLKLSLPRRLVRALVYHLEHDLSFFLPEKDWLYLSRATINHASALAGQFVHAHLCKRQRTLWDVPEDFLPLIWIEAVGFFFSKWINPKRKAETLESIRLQLAARRPKDKGRQALLLALDHRLSEVVWVQTGRLRRAGFKPRQMDAYLEASRIIGSMLGERLFQKVRSRTISLPQLMSYLRIKVEDKKFAKFYWQLIRELEHDQTL